MSNLTLEPKLTTSIVESITDLCKVGLYHQALAKAESEWGPINTWRSHDQSLIAIRLYMNLGGDRKSDALLLNLWRKNKNSPELLNKIFFYQLNKVGPILTNEFVKEYESNILKLDCNKSDLLGFKSIIQRIFKHYAKADNLLDEAIVINPSDSWLTALKIQLLSEQGELTEAKSQAIKHFDAYPSPYNLRALSNILTKVDGLTASIDLYALHASNYESASVWLEYAQLLAGNFDWPTCQYAIEQFELTRITKDKRDEQFLLSWKGQIAIHYQQIDKAIELLSQHKNNYWQVVTKNLKNSKGELERKVLDVPFLKQEHMTCAPTTLAALCRYWGKNFDSKTIADSICFDGTPATKERQWLRGNAFYFKEFELETELAYSLIESDIPFALVTTHGFSAHIQAVIGFNKQVGTLYVMDPSHALMQEMLTKETIASEAYSGARCIAFVPKDKSQLLSQFSFPAADLFPLWDEYSQAEERNDYITAKSAVDKLQQKAPEHRITLRVERSFAVWNNDTSCILKLNDQLLDKFPNETLLLNSKFYCLRDLGKREAGLSLLSTYLEKYTNVDLLGTLFDQIYDTNEHHDLTLSSLTKIKEYGSHSAYSHWSLGNYYWSHQSFELATEHYLYAYCLDETHSNYIESYFKASRYLNKENEAIAFLQNRFHKYKIRSADPAISLYKAYELLDQEHIGIDYLFEALTLHASDINLIIYLANRLIERGLISRFESIESQIKPHIDVKDFNELLAKKNERLGEFELAIGFFETAFSENPFIQKYATSYFGLLMKRGDSAKIDSILEQLYEQEPQNTQTLDYIADWHNDPVFQEKVLTSFVALRPDYGMIRRQLIDVRLKLGMFEQALAQAKDTCQNIVGEHINQSYLAKCYLKIGNFAQARDIAKQVILKTVENELAFHTLMEASTQKEEKQRSLEIVFTEIQSQVILGDAAWHFWFAAKSILSQAKLKAFIDYLLNQQNHQWYTYSLAANYFKQYNDLDKAKEILHQGKSKFPLTPRIYSDLGQLHELEGNFSQAIEANYQALLMNPAWPDVTKRQSELLEKHESLQAAIDVVTKGIKHNPNDGVLYGYLADLLLKQGKDQEAITPLKLAVRNNSDYRWAWDQLINIANEQGKCELPYELAKELSQQSPYLPHVWRDLACLTDDFQEKFALYNKSLSCDLYFIPSYLDKAQYYVNQGQFKEALRELEQTPWKDDLPIELTILKVDLLIEIGQKTLAITNLKKVIFNVHGYAHLWKKLFDLLEEQSSKQDYIDCCHKSVEQNRHDADILCYAGENLLKHGNDSEKEIAQKYLQQAFELSPNVQYIVLTYIDSLMESKKYQQALAAINEFEQRKVVSYATTRKIEILCQLDRASEALKTFKQTLSKNESDYWCLNQSFICLNEKYSFEDLAAVFKEQLINLNREQSYFYTDKCLYLENNNKYAHVLQDIKGYDNGELWIGAFLALLEFWNDKNITPPDKIVAMYFDRIIETPALVAQLSNGYVNAGHYHSLIKLFERTKDKANLPAYTFYHHRLALQMLGRWDEATDIINQGIKQQPDNTIHNMRLWYAYELSRTGQKLTYEDVEVIDYEELIENEKYVYSTLLVDLALGKDSLENQLDTLTPLLRKCRQDYQQTGGQALSIHARNSLKERLKNAIEAEGFFAKLKLAWWISNRF